MFGYRVVQKKWTIHTFLKCQSQLPFALWDTDFGQELGIPQDKEMISFDYGSTIAGKHSRERCIGDIN